MGATICCNAFAPLGGPEPVRLQIYDVFGNKAVRSVNRLFRAMGTGAFHAAVEIYGKEWSFGYTEFGSGVFVCRPRGCEGHGYREQVAMGYTELTSAEVEDLVEEMTEEWRGTDYDLLHRNCCHFSDELCRRLDVGPIPRWVTNLAGAGATLNKGVKQAVSKAQGAVIIARAKAGEVDEKYRIRGRVTAKARDLLAKAGQIDPKAAASSLAGAASGAATSAASKAGSTARSFRRGASGAVVAGKEAGGRVLAMMHRPQSANAAPT